MPFLEEKLTASCIEQGKFDESSTFSSLINKLIISVGGDKGGNDLSMQFCVVNWKKGNYACYCIPISVVEKATEDYDNIKKTILNEQVRLLLPPLMDDEVYMLTLYFEQEVRCMAIHFN